jgi:hypothetical protein
MFINSNSNVGLFIGRSSATGGPRRIKTCRNSAIWQEKEEEKNVGPLLLTKQSRVVVVRQRLNLFSKPFQIHSKPKAKPLTAPNPLLWLNSVLDLYVKR